MVEEFDVRPARSCTGGPPATGPYTAGMLDPRHELLIEFCVP